MNPNPLHVSSDQTPTEQLITKILSEFADQYGLDLSQDPVALERIKVAVNQVYLDLKNQSEVEINLPSISANSAGPIHLSRKITRAELGQDFPEINFSSGEEKDPEPTESPPAPRVTIQLPDGKPYVTTSLLVIIVIIYILQMGTELFLGYDLLAVYGMKSNELIIAGQYWRLFTAMFLHGSLLHLGFNLYALYILGRRVERFFGSFRFLGLFLIAGMMGNLFSFFFTSAPSLGSSTAIFGLLGAEGVFIYQHRKLIGDQFKVAMRQIIQVAGINILIGLSPGIDNWGHIGGLLGGVIFTWFGGPVYKVLNTPPQLRLEDQRAEEKSGLIFIALLIVIISLVAWIILSRS